MDLSEATNSTPILDDLIIGDPISQHHGVKCCPAIRESTDERYIVKILSFPASSVQLDALLLTGAYPTPAHALEYFHERAKEVLQEAEILNRLHALEGFLPFTHAEIRESSDSVGYQVYLVSPYKRSLERQMQLNPLTHLGAVNLGLDLCAALAICRRAGFLYIDLKPTNVYVTPNQGYRISDLGFIPLSSMKYASYPEQYRSPYTAPEIDDAMSSLNARIDIYALGLILYQVYNNGELPAVSGDILPPPTYADYEMAEIILKACDPNPSNRWADPLQMGQAIVAYMQRNSVNDTPIVPPTVEIPAEPEDDGSDDEEVTDDADDIVAEATDTEAPDEETSEQETETAPQSEAQNAPTDAEPAAEEETGFESPLAEDDSDDETLPTEESAAEIAEELVSEEVQQMLARADELISHELPEPAVAPDPIDVPFPAPITLEDKTEETADEPSEEPDADAGELPLEDASVEEDAVEQDDPEYATDDADASEETEEAEDEQETEEQNSEWGIETAGYRRPAHGDDHEATRAQRSGRGRKLITIAACFVLLAALIAGGILFYQYYYLQHVDAMTLDGSVDTLTAVITSSIDDELLTVVCTDTYGNTRIQQVINGTAHFADLNPNTQYRVQLNISGFHQLEGVTSGSYTTAAQTEILNFNAVAGPEDGSVILSFAVNGPETDAWTVAYSTGSDPETTLSFTGHTVTITDLTVGSEYQFRLIPADDQYLTGTLQLQYTAQQIVCAQELSVSSCGDGTLVAVWSVPEGVVGQSWIVRCYNSDGYDQTVTVTEPTATFTGLDHSHGYTVEVTASGMTQSATVTVTPNPVTLTSINGSAEKNYVLKLDWEYTGEAPAEGWLLDYTVDGGAAITVSCPENTAQITLYPGSQYEIDVRPVGEVTFFGKHLSYKADQAAKFSNYGVSADDMSFYMCRTPDKANWDRYDVPRSDYTKTFKIGVKASFLVELWDSYKKSKDKVTVTYIIRDDAGVPVSLNSVESTWNKLWNKKFCELDIPQMPETAGQYTVDIYFNGQIINKDTLNFSVT